MNEPDRNREAQLDRLFARVRAASRPLPDADPHLPTRIRGISQARSEAGGERRRSPGRWALASLATVAVVFAAGLGTWVGHRAAATSQSFTHEEARDADVFMAALSQGGVVDDLSRLDPANREVNQ